MRHAERITKREFMRLGGLRNGDLFRSSDKRGRWSYFHVHDNR